MVKKKRPDRVRKHTDGEERGSDHANYILPDGGNESNNHSLEEGGEELGYAARREEGSTIKTPATNRGSEDENNTQDGLEFGIDYLALTIFADEQIAIRLYNLILMDYLGELVIDKPKPRYEHSYTSGTGAQLLTLPKDRMVRNNSRLEIKGAGCRQIPLEAIQKLVNTAADNGIEMNCTRLDLIIDKGKFTPYQIADEIEAGRAKTRADLGSLTKYANPLDENEQGKIGMQTIYLGRRTSDKFLRCYDQHGFTRIELECKGDASRAYLPRIANMDKDKFAEFTMQRIRQFLELDTDWWREFTGNKKREYIKTGNYYDPTLDRIEKTMRQQVAPLIGLLRAIKGEKQMEKYMNELYRYGWERARKRPKYYPLIHAYGIENERIE